ncbi:MAG: ribosome-binding factor A [Candidatus Peregrinibacteria bacterium]
MSSKRPAMVGSVVRSVIAPFLRECPQACGIVSLTEVEVSSDLSYATCYVSALFDPQQAVTFLKEQIPELRSRLGKALQIHRTPLIRFRIDPRAERASRLDELLK